jgi:hypothetical protein
MNNEHFINILIHVITLIIIIDQYIDELKSWEFVVTYTNGTEFYYDGPSSRSYGMLKVLLEMAPSQDERIQWDSLKLVMHTSSQSVIYIFLNP